jgi:3-hydroxyacyl-CoA dehydrogenase
MALGGGAEVVLAAPFVRAASGLNLGLVESKVGLVPAAGGVKELILRSVAGLPENVDRVPFLSIALERLSKGYVSPNALEALKIGLLRSTDSASMNAKGLLREAKDIVLHLSAMGYVPAMPSKFKVAGPREAEALRGVVAAMREAGALGEYGAHIGDKLVHIMTGGGAPENSYVDEYRLVVLELEVFIELVQDTRTHDRIRHMLEKGVPLVN